MQGQTPAERKAPGREIKKYLAIDPGIGYIICRSLRETDVNGRLFIAGMLLAGADQKPE